MSKANCTYKFQTAAGPVTIQGMANMKAWLAVNGVESIIREPLNATDTPEFKRWFGDSKVVDADGRPLVVYHGTQADFSTFDGERQGESVSGRGGDVGFFFINDPEAASDHAMADWWRDNPAPNVMPVYLSMQNPEIIDGIGQPSRWYDENGRKASLKAIAEGKDGLIIGNGDVNLYVAFKNTQIKSATGNRGTFDPNNPDIRFRTVRSAVSEAVNDFRDVALPVGYKVNDFLGTPGKLHWWFKSIGTQFNLAQREPLYRRVFEGAQNFLNDVSHYANEAGNLAPTILPRLETLGDIRKKPISAQDSQAISRPIFEGTLIWGRDPSTGKAVKMDVLEARAANLDTQAKGQELIRRNLLDPKVLRMWQGLPLDQYTSMVENKYAREVLKPGTVFTDSELKDLFGLNANQIKLYREFRMATNKSLGNLAITDMVRFGGKDVEAVKDKALAAQTPRMAARILRDHLSVIADMQPERRDVLMDTADRIVSKADMAVDMMDRGYAPLMRFGQYTVDVLDENGDRAYFGMFETGREANKMARQMQANYPGGTVVQGTLSQEEYKLFSGMSPETAELFGDMLGLEADGEGAGNAAFQEFLKKAKANRSAMKRLIHRKGIAGFNEEPGRVLAGFLYSNARQSSGNVHMGEVTQAVADIPKDQGELKDHAMRLREYVMNPQEEAQALRSVLFAQYLGGSIASALLNALQPVQVTFPWLSQFTSVADAAKQMTAAIKDVLGNSQLDDRLAKALHQAEEDGIVSPQEIHQLQAQAAGRAALVGGDGTRTGTVLAAGNNTLSRVSLAWGKLFSVAEQFNRRTTYIAAYRIAVDQKMSNPDAFARQAVNETQFIYNKGNKPRWARGAIGATLFTFKQYSVSYVELMHRMYTRGGPEGKKAALLGLSVLFLMSGADGLPFAEDIQDLIDGILQRMGYNISTRAAKEQFFIDVLGEDGARFVEKGLSGLPGAPIDVSGRMGLGNLIPGTGIFYRKDNYGRDIWEVMGPAGDLARRAAEAGEKAIKGEVLGPRGALMTISPVAIQNMGKSYEMATTGMYTDRAGRKVLDVDGYDAFWKGIGIQPAEVSKVQGASFEVQKGVAFNRLRESEIADRWAQGVFLGDQEMVTQARAQLAEWNEKNPDMPIRIKANQIAQRVRQLRMGREERMARTAPAEIRASVREELALGTR